MVKQKITNVHDEVVGYVKNKTYYITKRKEHFMVKFNGFGISEHILKRLEALKVEKVRFNYILPEETITYGCDLIKFLESKTSFIDERDGVKDKQIFVNIINMDKFQLNPIGGKKMETQEKLEKGIGNKETVALKPVKVKIEKVDVKPQKTKEGKDIGDKVVCSVKHPDKDETIDISTAKYEKNNQIKTTGLWFNLDEDELIQKGSALAIFLNHIEVKNIKELEGKEVETTQDDKGYLCFKAY